MPGNMKPSLDRLNQEVEIALATLNYPCQAWPEPPTASIIDTNHSNTTNQHVDVLIVGAGMCGQSVAFSLRREGVHRLRIIDRAARGQEGPWTNFARMNTLRSPKHLTGPDLGIPSLSFRAWFSALNGHGAWDSLHKIDRLDWYSYLQWLRERIGIAIDNDLEFKSVKPCVEDPNHRLDVLVQHRTSGHKELVTCRHLVLALGRDGGGGLRWPRFKTWRANNRGRFKSVWHAADPIDFKLMQGKHVAVLGAGASAFDNAACALEAGAASVELHVRRAQLPQINKSKGASYPGFQRGFFHLSDAQRWWIMNYIFDQQVPPPYESIHRCERFDHFKIRLSHNWEDLKILGNETQDVLVSTKQGSYVFGHVILATGFEVDLMSRPDHAGFATAVDRWDDHVSAEASSQFPESARFPYLGNGFEFLPRSDAKGYDWVQRIHAFNWGCAMSHGPLAGDIPGLRVGLERLTQAICSRLFLDDYPSRREALLAFDDRELESTRWFTQR